jgi:lysophospholipase L1-like esterase
MKYSNPGETLMTKLILTLALFVPSSGFSYQLQNRPVHVFMIGDSTMADKAPQAAPETGWGQAMQPFFKETVKVANHARNGRSSKSFIDEGLWGKVLQDLQPGDYAIIQFGHNDQKPDEPRHTDPFTTYKERLEQYVNETRAKGAFPILCTSIVRRKFDENGSLTDTHGDYPAAMKQVAQELKVPLIDLQFRTNGLVTDLGPEKSKSLYLYTDKVKDDTHLNTEGATAIARMAAEEIKALKLPLADFLK